ncbi:glycerol-3-phosphate acyltransferase PlsY [Niveibacterium umoris]|uniref:Glycerol-3-phosphate acyltransferase n=1 Tax=Niveibacterium umoris TaxID=1193620 RepID=A0A840BMV6_9RHOO|nr:glycerol-3-phosphate acyltransferase PlsY [Niveibacterium umoris]
MAYFLGSVPFAVLVSRAMGLEDPRQYGSGNPGATNVLRSGNKKAAILTLVGDALKGAVAVIAARMLAEAFGLSEFDAAAAGLFAFLGHVFSAFLRFQGGKGVATAAGVLMAMSPVVGGLTLLCWLTVAISTRYSSAAALAAALTAPALTYWRTPELAWTVSVAAMSLILIWRHKENISRLITGQESRIGNKKR